MTKEIFLKELRKNLKKLNSKNLHEELKAYENLNNYDLDPIVEANKIYEKYNTTYRVMPKISLYNAVKEKYPNNNNIFLIFIFLTNNY